MRLQVNQWVEVPALTRVSEIAEALCLIGRRYEAAELLACCASWDVETAEDLRRMVQDGEDLRIGSLEVIGGEVLSVLVRSMDTTLSRLVQQAELIS